jgi:hypothetical protein
VELIGLDRGSHPVERMLPHERDTARGFTVSSPEFFARISRWLGPLHR